MGSNSGRTRLLSWDFILRVGRHKKGFGTEGEHDQAEQNYAVRGFYPTRAYRNGGRLERKVMALKLNPGNTILQVKLVHYFNETISPHIKWIFLTYNIKINPYS